MTTTNDTHTIPPEWAQYDGTRFTQEHPMKRKGEKGGGLRSINRLQRTTLGSNGSALSSCAYSTGHPVISACSKPGLPAAQTSEYPCQDFLFYLRDPLHRLPHEKRGGYDAALTIHAHGKQAVPTPPYKLSQQTPNSRALRFRLTRLQISSLLLTPSII